MSRYKEKQIITIKNAFKRLRKINDQIFKKRNYDAYKIAPTVSIFFVDIYTGFHKNKKLNITHIITAAIKSAKNA